MSVYSCVYFCRVGRYIKIGTSYHPCGRSFNNFFGAMKPDDYEWRAPHEMLKIRYGDFDVERGIHSDLSEHRMVGEWFADCEGVRDYIRNYRTDRERLRAQAMSWRGYTEREAMFAVERRIREAEPWCSCAPRHVGDIDARPALPCSAHEDDASQRGVVTPSVRIRRPQAA